MEHCPNCRARTKGENECYRCGMDLSVLLTIESELENRYRVSVERIARGDFKGAEQVLKRVLGLRSDPFAHSLLGYVRSMRIGRTKVFL